MKTALITGAHGFIGRHLARQLADKGVKVCGLGHGAWPDAGEWGVSVWQNGEISQSNLERLLSISDTPDAIFHLAGGSSVGLSLQTPEEDFQRSAVSTSRLLEWARKRAPQARLVLSSSAAVYGDGHFAPIKEDVPCKPFSPYGYNKRIAELLFESYSRNFGMHTAVVRLFSVYGAGLRKQLLWDLCTRLKNGSETVTLSGSGSERRDWLSVHDAAAYLIGVSRLENRKFLVVNGGCGLAVDVGQIARYVCEIWGNGTKVEFDGAPRSGDPMFLVADTTLGRSIGLAPKTEWRKGIKEYIEWFQS
ncbi:MAG: NAD(P)-dependent oxidoreductase [Nitrospiraceae bacterium]|nr:NAD(P)-dependent oxidoreductase [Nitrospiraceae bacterium]